MAIAFKSKIGSELAIILTIIMGGISLVFIFTGLWFGLFIVLLPSAFIAHTMLSTSYTIDGNFLHIKSGFLVNKPVEIQSIKKVVETRNPISAPAMSLDRLEIFYNKFDSVLVSPEDKPEFIKQLKLINPAIEVQLKEGRI